MQSGKMVPLILYTSVPAPTGWENILLSAASVCKNKFVRYILPRDDRRNAQSGVPPGPEVMDL